MAVENIYNCNKTEWELSRLSDLILNEEAELQTGPFGTMLHASSYKPIGTPVIAVQHIGQNRIIHNDLPRVDDETVARLSRYKLQQNDILFSRKGAVDRCAIIQQTEEGWLQGSDCIRLRFKKRISSHFISYVFASKPFKGWIIRHAHGATMPSLNQEILGLIPIPIPPRKIQDEIATILTSLDNKIELNRRMNETLEAMARAIYKSWFVDFDPVHAKAAGKKPVGMDEETAALFPASFEDSAMGKIPKGWKWGKCGDVAENSRRIVNPENISANVPYIGLEHIPRKCLVLDSWGMAEDISSAKAEFSKNDILFGKLRPYFHKVGFALVDGICSTDIFVIVPKRQDLLPFVLLTVYRDDFVAYADSHSAGTKMPRANWSDLAKFDIPIVPELITSAFCQIAKPMLEIMAKYAIESFALKSIRDSLLPKLLSGEIE